MIPHDAIRLRNYQQKPSAIQLPSLPDSLLNGRASSCRFGKAPHVPGTAPVMLVWLIHLRGKKKEKEGGGVALGGSCLPA